MKNNFKPQLVLLRHGASLWNDLNLFTGWVDVPLSKKGIGEAILAGVKLKDFTPDVIFTSTLIRAQTTMVLVMAENKSGKVPVILHPEEGKMGEWSKIYDEKTKDSLIPAYEAWQLNERMYGELQGLNKDEARARFGKEQVHLWRRSYDIPPPGGESLKICAERTLPYYREKIVPCLKEGKNVLVVAHGNSLRSIIMAIEGLSEEAVLNLELATGDPVTYDIEKLDLSR
ncbi:MAG: 2,3-bisphosphoglycerate-dependent phosphoglycerate mutase [Parachlamydiaceae bacterium]